MTPTERVAAALRELGVDGELRTFAERTATAEEAAAAVGCAPGQIVKTLFFLADGRPTMVLMAGDRQVDTAALASLLGVSRKRLKMGSPEEVLEHTGYAVGGVAPVGWPGAADVVVDDSLRRFDRVWAAAGDAHAVFGVGLAELVGAIGGQWAAIAKGGG